MVTPLGWDNTFRFISGSWMFIDILVLFYYFKEMTENVAICTPQVLALYLFFMFLIALITIVPVSSPLAELSPFYDITGDEHDLPSFVDNSKLDGLSDGDGDDILDVDDE